MKRLLAMLLALVMVFGLIACSQNADTPADSQEPAAPAQEAPKDNEPKDDGKEEAPQADPVEPAEPAEPSTSDELFDPDYCEDAIEGSELESQFGPVSDLDIDYSDITVGAIVKTLANESWTSISNGYIDYMADKGVDLDLQAPDTESDQAQQLSMGEAMVNKEYKVMILSPQTNTCLDPVCETAQSMGTVVINAFDSTMQNADVFVGNISIDTGIMAADYIAKWAGETGKVACIEGLAGAYAAVQRTAGFTQQIAKYPNMELVASVPADWDRQVAMDTATNIINMYGDELVGIYCNNDTMALGAIEAVKTAGLLGKVCVVGSDGVTAIFESIAAGECTATVNLNLYKGGQIAAECALRIIGGQKLPRVVAVPQVIVDETNVAEYLN